MKPRRPRKVSIYRPSAGSESSKDDQLKALESQARQLGRSGTRMVEAVAVNSRILELDPQHLPALTRRGLAYLKLDDYQAARRDLLQARDLYPGSSLVDDALKKIAREWDAALVRTQRKPAENSNPVTRSRQGGSRYQKAEQARRSESARFRLAQEDKVRRQVAEEQARKKAAEKARRKTEKELRALEELTGFEEIYALGIAASKASSPNYVVAIAAFKKAYRLDPRRKVRPGRKPNPGLFEVPTRLAAAYRSNGQLYEAQRTYEWVLEHQDSRFAKVGLAAVYEDNRKHVQALELYESVLDRYPTDAYALRGVARTMASLGRVEEATDAYERAAATGEGRNNNAVIIALERMRDELIRKGEADRAKHVSLALQRTRGHEDQI